MNDKPVGKTGDGKSGIADEALMDTKLIGTVGRENANAAWANLYLVLTTGSPRDGKGIAFCDFCKRNAGKQFAILIDVCNISAGRLSCEENRKQTGKCQYQQDYANQHSQ